MDINITALKKLNEHGRVAKLVQEDNKEVTIIGGILTVDTTNNYFGLSSSKTATNIRVYVFPKTDKTNEFKKNVNKVVTITGTIKNGLLENATLVAVPPKK